MNSPFFNKLICVFSFVGAKEKRNFDTTKFYRQMVQYFNSFYPKIKESYIQSDMKAGTDYSSMSIYNFGIRNLNVYFYLKQ